jgi:hypothetical protein
VGNAFDFPIYAEKSKALGGETGIRTLGELAPTTVFETVPFDHSGTSPQGYFGRASARSALEARRLADGRSLAKPSIFSIWHR